MKNELIFIFDKNTMYSECFCPRGVTLYEEYSCLQNTRLSRALFRILLKKSRSKAKFYNKKLQNCNNSVILAFDTIDIEVIQWVRENNPQNRIIIYFINTVRNENRVTKYVELNCELWSFDKEDCEKYNMQFNDWYCCYKNSERFKKKHDVIFVGREKTRRPLLNKLAEYFEKNGVKYYFHVTPERNIPVFLSKKYKHQISYKKMIEIEKKSKAMIEIVEPGQNGSTLRLMDAVFNEVKLITNFKPIKNSELYIPNNIFILDEDPISELKAFIEKPFEKYPDSILNKYRYEEWIARFRI